MRIELIPFFCVLVLLLLFKLFHKNGFMPFKKDGDGSESKDGEKIDWAKKSKHSVLIIGLYSIANLLFWMVIPDIWMLWFNTKGLFFLGTQLAIVLLFILNIVFRDEKNKPVINTISWMIFIVLIAGFVNQLAIREQQSKKVVHNTSVQRQRVKTPRKEVSTVILMPERWYSVDVSSKYRNINMKPFDGIIVKLPNGTEYYDGPGLKINVNGGTQGTYSFRPVGHKPVKLQITLTRRS